MERVHTIFLHWVTDSTGLTRARGAFNRAELNELFDPTLEIAWDQVPQRFIPIDEESQDWEVGEVLGPQILSYMHGRRPSVKVDNICADLCELWWNMGPTTRNAFKKRVYEILLLAAHAELKEYIRIEGTNPQNFELTIRNNPLNLAAGKAPAAMRRIKKLQAAFLIRLQSNRKYIAVEQFDMFGEPHIVEPIVEPTDEENGG